MKFYKYIFILLLIFTGCNSNENRDLTKFQKGKKEKDSLILVAYKQKEAALKNKAEGIEVVKNYLTEETSTKNLLLFLNRLDKSEKQTLFPILRYIPSINPLNPKDKQVISSHYSLKRLHPLDFKQKAHHGIDIATEVGTLIYATAPGVITKIVYSKKGYGNYIEITHDLGFKTKYAHLSIIMVFEKGKKINLGDVIGMVGSTGKSTGNHLHYEVIKNEKSQNPISYFSIYENHFK